VGYIVKGKLHKNTGSLFLVFNKTQTLKRYTQAIKKGLCCPCPLHFAIGNVELWVGSVSQPRFGFHHGGVTNFIKL
jgi:hypothetical protein